MKVLVTGGAGYIGAVLVPWLLADGHEVTVLDTQWFGSGYLPDNSNLAVIKGDVRDHATLKEAIRGQEAVIWLASISSDAMCQRERILAERVNCLGTVNGLSAAYLCDVRRFIYASSVAAYGSSDKDATEEQPLEPSTVYGEGKKESEQWAKFFDRTIVRCASVCGYSPHQRFDLTVNMMVHDAMRKGVITVSGGEQKRSHIHIQDVCDFYRRLLDVPEEKIAGQVFNVVAVNETVAETAKLVASETGARIETRPRSDNRSYTVDGTKAREVLGFTPRRSIRQAVIDLKARFDAGYWPDSMTNQAYMNLADGLV